MTATATEPILIASAYCNRGEASNALRDTEQAEEAYDRSLALFEKTVGSMHPERAFALHGLGTTKLARGVPDGRDSPALASPGDPPSAGWRSGPRGGDAVRARPRSLARRRRSNESTLPGRRRAQDLPRWAQSRTRTRRRSLARRPPRSEATALFSEKRKRQFFADLRRCHDLLVVTPISRAFVVGSAMFCLTGFSIYQYYSHAVCS